MSTTGRQQRRGRAAASGAVLGTPFLHPAVSGTFLLPASGIERCAREFRRVFSTSCIVYLAPFTRLLAGIDYLAITVFRIVRGHSCLSVVPFSPFLSPVMALRLFVLPPPRPARPLVFFLSVLARSSAPLRSGRRVVCRNFSPSSVHIVTE